MERQPTVIPWSDLEIAFCNTTPGYRRYLDLAVGQVVTVQVQIPANVTTLQRVTADPRRFVRIPSFSSREQHGWMTGFIATVEDPQLRARLSEAIEGTGSFQRFKQILRGEPAERQRWFESRSSLLRAHIAAWLQLHGIRASEGPAPAGAGEASEIMIGEAALRSLARTQLERLPAHALPSAVGFLGYLEAKRA